MEHTSALFSLFLSVDANRQLALSNQIICEGIMPVQKVGTPNMVEVTTS
jgi:hypothetical protein